MRESVYSLDDLVAVVLKMMEAKDPVTFSHSLRVGYYSAQIGRRLAFPENQIQFLRWGGVLHDVGKIGIPDSILKKPGKLTSEEFSVIKTHTTLGYGILHKVKKLNGFAEIARDHHLRPDGTGYPEVAPNQQYKPYAKVHVHTRIITVADVFDVMWAGRTYSERKPLAWIAKEFQRCINTQFDGTAVQALFDYLEMRYGKEALRSPQTVEEAREIDLKKAG
jgi:putative nucleotidyltransferase with HDIG domain